MKISSCSVLFLVLICTGVVAHAGHLNELGISAEESQLFYGKQMRKQRESAKQREKDRRRKGVYERRRVKEAQDELSREVSE